MYALAAELLICGFLHATSSTQDLYIYCLIITSIIKNNFSALNYHYYFFICQDSSFYRMPRLGNV